ncbi:MAG: hypothetical protein QOG73_1296 [Acetobacteraceae bacterium]|nr:hypothetical protein [Acetobacteraceae bacterium]
MRNLTFRDMRGAPQDGTAVEVQHGPDQAGWRDGADHRRAPTPARTIAPGQPPDQRPGAACSLSTGKTLGTKRPISAVVQHCSVRVKHQRITSTLSPRSTPSR